MTAYINKAFLEGKSTIGSVLLSLEDRRLNQADYARVNLIPVRVREDRPRMLKVGDIINARCEVLVTLPGGKRKWMITSHHMHGIKVGRTMKGGYRFNPNLPIL